MKLIITNKTAYDTKEVSSLARFASRVVYKVAKYEDWYYLLDQFPVYIRFGNTRYAYGGRAYGRWYARTVPGAGTLPPEAVVWKILIRVGRPSTFPVLDATDKRYQAMPKMSVLTWQEAVVMVVAHELGHCKWPRGREGEHRCNLLGVNAIDHYRRETAPVERTGPTRAEVAT